MKRVRNSDNSLIGRKFGRLSIIAQADIHTSPTNGRKYKMWLCECDCSNKILVKEQALKSGNTKSCGCLAKEMSINNIKIINISARENTPEFPNTLYDDELNILKGHLLGDGYLKKTGYGAVLRIKRAAKDVEYLTYTSEKLVRLNHLSNRVKYSQYFDDRTQKIYDGYYYNTFSKNVLENIHNEWYPNKTKIIPLDLKLNSHIIAIWFADDGWASGRRGEMRISFATDSFTENEVDRLIFLLREFYKTPNIFKYQKGMTSKGKIIWRISAINISAVKIMRDLEKYLSIFKMERKIKWHEDDLKRYESGNYRIINKIGRKL